MTHPSLRIIREEHMALAAMVRSLGMMLDRGDVGRQFASWLDERHVVS